MAYAEEVGFDAIIERGRRAAEQHPGRSVYVGISLGVLPAQMLAQTRSDAVGAVLISAASLSEYDQAAAELLIERIIAFLDAVPR